MTAIYTVERLHQPTGRWDEVNRYSREYAAVTALGNYDRTLGAPAGALRLCRYDQDASRLSLDPAARTVLTDNRGEKLARELFELLKKHNCIEADTWSDFVELFRENEREPREYLICLKATLRDHILDYWPDQI